MGLRGLRVESMGLGKPVIKAIDEKMGWFSSKHIN